MFFEQILNQPSVKATIKSEVSRLNDLKNCEYHRAKIKQFLSDYNHCVEENLKLKESNLRHTLRLKTLEQKLEVATKRLN